MKRNAFSLLFLFLASMISACSTVPSPNSSNASSVTLLSSQANEATNTPLVTQINGATTNTVRTFGLVVKNLGNPIFDIANIGAQEAAKELGATVIFTGPVTPDAALQIQLIKSLIARKVNGLAISADDTEALVPVGKDAKAAGIPVISWDSMIAKEGRILHIQNFDIMGLGEIQIKMASEIAGPDGGDIAIIRVACMACDQDAWLSIMKEILKRPEYAKLHLVEWVYVDDDDTKSYNEALGLIDKYPNLKVIICPTTVGIVAAARAVTDRGLIGKVFVTGLGNPKAMREYVKSGAAPMFALWNPADLGYLTIYTLNALATKQTTGKEGETFTAGRLGEYTIKVDPDMGPNILLGLPFVWDKDNIDEPYSQF